MATPTWSFQDDRGHHVTAGHRPRRVVAYLQAAATLWDLGARPLGGFGSPHDGDTPDPVKSASLPPGALTYFGAGGTLRLDALLDAEPDLLVTVTYDGKTLYGLPPDAADILDARLPCVALSVEPGRDLAAVRDRFRALAAALGAPDGVGHAGLAAEEERLRAVARRSAGAGVLALSAAGPDTVHLARAGAWPDLRALTALGVTVLEPAAGPGANWSTTRWSEAVALAPRVVLADARGNARAAQELKHSADWRALADAAEIVPWNPEAPASDTAHAVFLTGVREALERLSPPV